MTTAPALRPGGRRHHAGCGDPVAARRVRAVPLGPVMKPAAVPLDVWEAIADALLKGRQLSADYLSRSKGEVRTMRLHPQGLASRGAVTYLIGSVDGYDDLRHFALHRIRSAETLATSAKDCGFEIDAYLRAASFAPRHGRGLVSLHALVAPRLAWTLRELPVGDSQRLTPTAGGTSEYLEVFVSDDEETIRWVRTQGPDIEVLSPVGWRKRLAAEAKVLAERYALMGAKSSSEEISFAEIAIAASGGAQA